MSSSGPIPINNDGCDHRLDEDQEQEIGCSPGAMDQSSEYDVRRDTPPRRRRAPMNICLAFIVCLLHYLFIVPFKILLCVLSLLETSMCLWFILICMPIILISPVLYRKIVDFFVEEFCKFTVQMYCLTTRAKLNLSGSIVEKFEKANPNSLGKEGSSLWPIFLCNHKTQTDMLAAWMLLYKLNIPCTVVKFMAAAYTRYVPGYGCGLQVMRSIFLTRTNAERDLRQIRNTMAFHAFYGIPKGVMLYPEGTTVYKDSLAATNKYALKHNLPPRKYSLYPRHKGTYELLQVMRESSMLNDLYDLTLAYEEFRGSDDDYTVAKLFIQGPVQRKVHIHIEKYDALALSEYCESEFKQWLFEVYDEKEKRLEYFEEKSEPPSLDYRHEETVQDASFTCFEYFSGFCRIVWHLSLVVLIFVLPWYYVRFYRIHEYVGLICYPVALMALTVLGFFVGLDRIERGLERLHLLIICWPLIQWKVDHIPCVHANPDDVPPNDATKVNWLTSNLSSRFFSAENNPALRLGNRISVWTARFDFPNLGGQNNAANPGDDDCDQGQTMLSGGDVMNEQRHRLQQQHMGSVINPYNNISIMSPEEPVLSLRTVPPLSSTLPHTSYLNMSTNDTNINNNKSGTTSSNIGTTLVYNGRGDTIPSAQNAYQITNVYNPNEEESVAI